MKDDIKIKYDEITNTIVNIKKSIGNIEEVLNYSTKAMSTLDEKKWQGPEKEIITNDFIPYLQKLSQDYISELNEHNKLLASSVMNYQLLDQQLQSLIERGE